MRDKQKVIGDKTEYQWDHIYGVNATKKGKYLTEIEQKFINSALDLKGKNKITILDIGEEGLEEIATPLYQKGLKTIVLDYDALPLKILHHREPDIHIVRADGQYLPFKEKVFDLLWEF